MNNTGVPSPDSGQDWGVELLQQRGAESLEKRVKFQENPEPRCPCVLLLDNSGSMTGPPIRALNEGLMAFQQDVIRDPLARKRVEVAVITFGGEVKVIQDFVTADSFAPPLLEANGLTPMGAAILRALDLLEVEKGAYKANGISYLRPWIMMITDGAPQGEPEHLFQQAVQRVRAAENGHHVAFWAIGVEGADFAKLAEITTRPIAKLRELRFTPLFEWLSNSMQQASSSRPGDKIKLPPISGWAEVQV